MDVTLWKKRGDKVVISLPALAAVRAYHAHVAILNHAWCTYYRVTTNDPGAGNRILHDSDKERGVA